MGSFRYLLLSLLAFLIVFTVTSCDDGGTTTKTVECTVPTECKANQDCVFDSLTAEKGVCTNRVVCEAKTDCSDGLLCADDGGSKFCGSRDVFGIKAVTLDDAKKDEFYPIVKLEVTGSQAEYYFEVVDDTKLPAGLELSPEGNLSGTITADVGEYTFTVKAVNGPKDASHYYNYREATEDLTIKVVEGAVTCKVDSCTEAHKTVCSVENDAIVCSCDTGYQDNDDNGSCEETCGMSNLGCTDTQHCDDAAGTAICVCNQNWQDDGNGGKCNACVSGMHINPDDATVCDSDVRVVTCTNVPDATTATWEDAFDNGDFEQTWVNGEYIPNVDPDKCLWKCNDTNKVHDVDANACICSTGLVDDGNGGCKTPCLDNQISNGDGTCSCYPGFGGDDCLACAVGYKPANGHCVFDCSDKTNAHVNDSNDNCVCDDGYFDDGAGVCVNPCQGDNAPDCGDTKTCIAVDATTTNCICDAGLNFVDDGAGNCGCDTANTHRVENLGSCECDSDNGYAEDLDGTCSLDTACTVDSFTSVDPANDGYATAADLTSELVDGMVHYDDLNNQAIDCSSTEDWYMVSVAANQKLDVNIDFVNADGNLDLKLYVGGDGYGDDIETSNWSSKDHEEVSHVFREDTDVYIKVYASSYSLARNTYTMDVKVADVAPITDLDGGDTCDVAVEITQSGTYHGTTAGKTDAVDSLCSTDGIAPEVFYTITPDHDVKLIATLDSIDFDAIISLTSSCDATEAIECHDIGEKIEQDLTAGQTYIIAIDGWDGDSGEFNLDVEFVEPTQPAVCDPACDAEKETCSDVDGTTTCVCDAEKGYFDNGFACVNPCSATTCDENSYCEASDALSTECVCDDGYNELDGTCAQAQYFTGADTCGDGSNLPEITETGIYTGSVNTNDTTVECSYDDGNDVFYKLVLAEDSYINITETEDFDTFNAAFALRDSCDATTDLACEYFDTAGIKGLYPAGTYYLVLEGSTGDVNYSLNVIIKPNPCTGVACDGANESGTCTASDDGSTYTCECSDNYFKDENGACVSPCDTAACPDANANGTGCVASSLTDYSCGCADNYFEVIATDETRTCESGCEATSLDCSAEGNNVECRSTSATEAECGCANGYIDTDDTDVFACVAMTNGGDTCTDAVSITEGTYYGSTEGFTNDYTNEATCITESENGRDVVYSVEVPAGYTLDATLDANSTWVGLYLLDDCTTMNCLVANNTATTNPPTSIQYINTTDTPMTLFVVLDSYSTNSSMNYQLDVAITPPPLCGNGTIDTADGEECDPNATDPLAGETCSLGGDLACDSECHFDRTSCWECDGTDDATQCTEAAKPLCYVATHTCGAAQAVCGNNTIESPEECDGTASFDSSCPAGSVGVKTCVAAGEANECTIDDTACQACEDDLTINANPKNDTRDNALELNLTNNEGSWDNLTTSLVNNDACAQADDWYKVTVPANYKISADISFTNTDGDLDLRLYKGTDTATVDSSAGSSDNEHVDNVGKLQDVATDYFIKVDPYSSAQNTYSLVIKLEETCTVDADCSTTGDLCLSGACYDSTPCTATICDSKPHSTCVATSNVDYTCVCDDTYTELNGECLIPQDVVGADTCDPDTNIPVIDHTGIWTGSVTADNNSPGCRPTTGRNDVLYKVVLAEDSYFSVDGSDDNFDGYTAFREVCADDSNELACGDFGYNDSFNGFYPAGTYYLLLEAYSASEADPYKISVIINPNPCNSVTCDGANESGVCTPSSDATSYTCECNDDYFKDENGACVSPCAADTCDAKANSTCKATSATEYTCECDAGLIDDGNGNCVDVCAGNTCDATTQVCVPVDATTYNCECTDGYISDGNGNCVVDLGVDACTDPNLYTIDASGTYYGTTSGFATDYSCGAGSGHDAVYAVNLNVGDKLDVTLSSTQDTVLFLMKTCSNDAANCLEEKDDGLSGGSETFSFTATEAATYIIGLRRYGATSDMDYSLEVTLTPAAPIQTIDWCNTQSPEATTTKGDTVYGRVYVNGVTEAAGQGAGITAQLCYYLDGDTIDNATCVDASYNVDDANNDEYMATLPADLADGTYHYFFQFMNDGDTVYSKCDLNNTTASTDGTDYANGGSYQGDTGTATIASQAAALLPNGDFESWTGDVPDSWTTIDGGVDLAQEQTTVHGGNSSMAVTVNTGTQGNTDIRQTINVTNGTVYNVSVWVYHPSGTHLKVTIYDTDYSNKFSDNTVLDGWQEITHSFTATADTAEIGLRFYDQSGFAPGEVVYVDDFTVIAQ